MGLDVVELVLRCEEEFAVDLADDRLESMRTVGDLLELICEQLKIPFGPDAPRPASRVFIPRGSPPAGGWTRDSIWFKLVQICVDELAVEDYEVTYSASFVDDLGAD